MYYVKSIITATIVFLVMDSLWLGLIAKNLYISQMGAFLSVQDNSITVNYFAAAIVYIALIAGIIIFVLPKAAGDPFAALMWGALFGMVVYATYDFTNLAIVKNWPLWISVIDVIWGCVVCGVSSFVTVLLNKPH